MSGSALIVATNALMLKRTKLEGILSLVRTRCPGRRRGGDERKLAAVMKELASETRDQCDDVTRWGHEGAHTELAASEKAISRSRLQVLTWRRDDKPKGEKSWHGLRQIGSGC